MTLKNRIAALDNLISQVMVKEITNRERIRHLEKQIEHFEKNRKMVIDRIDRIEEVINEIDPRKPF